MDVKKTEKNNNSNNNHNNVFVIRECSDSDLFKTSFFAHFRVAFCK